ncbi:MAG TPA: Holliday junction resolvase RuvX [Candidatus Enterousia avicola]|uniref:Putative pre-16S rRNA nuclease n=1 Tax=Candidatus Enterousia avicola TaxID=2840787 RepID=A0A9D1SMT8_9PROT|nr:Holliday junction resolvase RuvX [Candidatus Enterousia avicola]
MILPDFNDFPRKGRLLGIDWGARRTGVAVSDENRDFVFARPAIVFANGDLSIARQIADVANEEKVVGIVIGLPVYSDGSESETTKTVRLCATELCTYTDLPIAFIDETLTSMSAQESMGKIRVSDIKTKLDSESARIILENAISIIKRLK